MATAEIDATHRVIDSDHGHDAFLVEPESVGPPLAAFLAPDPGESETFGCAAPALCPD